MKKTYILGLLAIALSACNEEETATLLPNSGAENATSGTENVTSDELVRAITVEVSDYELSEPATRTHIDASTLSFTWAEDDVIGIFPEVGDQVYFPMTEGAGTKVAAFDGGGWALRSSYSYSAYYPFSAGNYLVHPYTALPHSYAGQRQTANNSTAHLGAYDFMAATAATPESGNVTFHFAHVNSLMYLTFTCPIADTFTELTLSAEEAIFVEEATVNISTAAVTPTKKLKTVTLPLDNISVEAGEMLKLWIATGPQDMSGKTLTATLTTANNTKYINELAGENLESGKAYRWEQTAKSKPAERLTLNRKRIQQIVGTTYQLTATIAPNDVADKSCTWTSSDPSVVTVDETGLLTIIAVGEAEITAIANSNTELKAVCEVKTGDDPFNGHEYVDLGITNDQGEPLYWATCNVGATTPEEYGDYFAWGEIEPKTDYSWSTFKWCNGSKNTLTKYNTKSSSGTVDNKTVLEPEDDAARQNWGGTWRMPTKSEFKQLYDDCTWTWDSTKKGYLVTGTNGNSIFLPAAGNRAETPLFEQGLHGLYWSSTLMSSSTSAARRLYFHSQGFYLDDAGLSRSEGNSVRPVTE